MLKRCTALSRHPVRSHRRRHRGARISAAKTSSPCALGTIFWESVECPAGTLERPNENDTSGQNQFASHGFREDARLTAVTLRISQNKLANRSPSHRDRNAP